MPEQNAEIRGSDLDELLWDAVFQGTSVFGRLVAVSALRQLDTGRYDHPLAAQYGADAVDQVLRDMHRQVFQSWLVLRLQLQECDISVWLAWMERNNRDGAAQLSDIMRHPEDLLPAQRMEMERQLFLGDLRLVVSLMDYSLRHENTDD